MAKTKMLPTKKSSQGRGVGFRLAWKGPEVLMRMTYAAGVVMAAQMFEAEQDAKSRLWPGHGKDTGAMQRGVHVAEPGHDWNSEHVEANQSAPERGGKVILPNIIRGKLAFELGCGQKYTIFYHQMKDPFLRLAFDRAMKDFKAKVEASWRMAS